MKEIRVNAEQFRRDLTELLSQAGYGGATVVVERHGTPLAALIPYEEYQKRSTTQEYAPGETLQSAEGTVLREAPALYDARRPRVEASVLMIEEAAAYLRTTVDTLRSEAERGEIPARKLGNSWRFSRQALDHWLQPHNSRQALLAQAGIFAEDSSLEAMIAAIYQQRGRAEGEVDPAAKRLP